MRHTPPHPALQMADIKYSYPKYKKWQCTACNFIYDEEFGDEEEGFPPSTRFKDIDDNWICPVCGVFGTKEMFVEMEE